MILNITIHATSLCVAFRDIIYSTVPYQGYCVSRWHCRTGADIVQYNVYAIILSAVRQIDMHPFHLATASKNERQKKKKTRSPPSQNKELGPNLALIQV